MKEAARMGEMEIFPECRHPEKKLRSVLKKFTPERYDH